MDEQIISVYVKTDTNDCIIAINSDIFLTDLTGWVKIDNSTGGRPRDCYAHAQGNYLDEPITDDNGCYNYKIVDGALSECTTEDKQAEIADRPPPPPTVEEQLAELQKTTLDIAEMQLQQQYEADLKELGVG